jgi:glyoxylase I family protein
VATVFHHVGFVCKDPHKVEQWYAKYFGFKRARVAAPGPDQVLFLKRDDCYLEVFKATKDSPAPLPEGAGPEYPGWRHLAFKVDNIDDLLAQMGADARITLGPMDFGQFIPGWRTVWVADPEGNIVEISQGYVDEANPPGD